MSGLFGGGHTQSATPQRYNGIQISSSSAGGCIPLLYGRQRLPFNLIWYGAFTSTPNKSSSGGKGGGSQQPSSYTYKSSFAAGICEGPITNIINVWNDKDLTTLSALGFVLFNGAGGQAAWSYLTTNFPAQAIPYDHICYTGAVNYVLGESASLPNITFEVDGFLGQTAPITVTATGSPALGAVNLTLSTGWGHATGQWDITFADGEERVGTFVAGNTAVFWTGGLVNAQATATLLIGGAYDSDPSVFIPDYLTDPNHGAGYTGTVAPLTGTNSYQSYVQSLGLLLSLCETTQRSASDCIKEVLKITNSDAVVSYDTLKILPYCDAPVSGNGFSFTPNLTPIFIFTDDDFIDAPELTRVATADTYNHVRVEYLDRSNQYNTAVCEATDIGDIALTGERVMDTLNFHEITSSAVAQIAAQLILQTSLYERNTIKFKVRADFCLLEPMDYIGVTDQGLGYVGQVFRITKVTDDENDELEIEAMEIPGTVRTSALYSWQSVQGFNANFGATPPPVQAPVFMEAFGVLVGASGGRQLWIAVNGPASSTEWGGAQVFMSFDGTTYENISTITSPCRYGTITSNVSAITTQPDTTTTMGVALNNTLQVLDSGSAADAQDNRMLIAVGSGATLEIMSFETATLVSAGNYNLTTLYRGVYGTDSQSHLSGAQFIRIDGNLFSIPIDPGWLGQTLHFKFCSYNKVGRSVQDISTVTDYTYTPGQSAVAYNSVSESTFAVNGPSAVVFSPTTAFKVTTGNSSAWDSSVYSVQSYTNGCTAECSPSNITTDLMLGLTLNPLSSPSYTNLAYAWFMAAGGLQIYESGTGIGTFGTYAAGDNLAITYDGKHVVYYHNGVILRSVTIANQTFFMQIAFLSAGAAVFGMTYSSQSPVSTPLTLINFNGNSACVGSTAYKVSGTTAWDASVYSTQSYTNGCSLSCNQTSVLGASDDMMGLTLNPTAGVSYTNLAYAFQMNGTVWAIFESGTGIVSGGAYTNATVFEIIYDGKHVQYYVAGVLVRSVPIANQTFFMQIALGNPNDIVSNINWGPIATAVTPFTLIPMSLNVAAAGTKVTSNTFGSNGWGTKNFQSAESYNNGAQLTFQVNPISDAQFIGFSQSPATGDTTGLVHTLAGWYPHVGSTDCEILFNGANLGSFGSTPVLTDVFTITYDNFSFRWWRDGALLHEEYFPNAGPLFLFGDFFEINEGFSNISFGPYGQLSPNPFIATNGAVTHDSTMYKSFSATAWDSSVYSLNAYSVCHLQAKTSSPAKHAMIGLSFNPILSPSFTNINYAWYNDAGTWEIYESGTFTGVSITGAATDLVAITYDGATVTYLLNNASARTVSVASAVFYLEASFDDVGSGWNSVSFGPGTTLDTIPTASIDPNAVSQIISTFDSSLGTSNVNASTSPVNIDLVTATFTCTGNPVAIDWSINYGVNANGSSSVTALTFTIFRDGAALSSGQGTYTNNIPGTGFLFGSSNYSLATMTATDTAAAGSHTYSLHVIASGTGSGSGIPIASAFFHWTNAFIKVREIKK